MSSTLYVRQLPFMFRLAFHHLVSFKGRNTDMYRLCTPVYFGHGLYGAVRFFRVRYGDVFVSAVVVVVTECETVFILYSGREFEVVYERRFYVRTSYRYVEISVLYYVQG